MNDPALSKCAPVSLLSYPANEHCADASASKKSDLDVRRLEEGNASDGGSDNHSTLKKSAEDIPTHIPDSGKRPSHISSKSGVSEAGRKNIFNYRKFFTAVVRDLTRALGISALSIFVMLACIPWLICLSNEAFLGIAIAALGTPFMEMAVALYLAEERTHLWKIFYLRSITFVSLSIMLYRMKDFSLWIIFLISEGIQTITMTFDHHYLFPRPTMKVIRKIGFCLATSIAYRMQLVFHVAGIVGVLYLNSATGIPETLQVAITGIVFPTLKTVFIFQFSAYCDTVFGKKRVPWPGMEIALEAALAFLTKLCILFRFRFDHYFFITVLLNVILRILVRLVVGGALRFTGKPACEYKYGRFVRYLYPFSEGLKYTITFTEDGECMAAICAAISALVVTIASEGDISISLVYKILVILSAEIGCKFFMVADEMRNGRLLGEYPIWVGPVPGLLIL